MKHAADLFKAVVKIILSLMSAAISSPIVNSLPENSFMQRLGAFLALAAIVGVYYLLGYVPFLKTSSVPFGNTSPVYLTLSFIYAIITALLILAVGLSIMGYMWASPSEPNIFALYGLLGLIFLGPVWFVLFFWRRSYVNKQQL